MKLQTYMLRNNLNIETLAQKLEVSPSSAYRYMRGKRYPNSRIMLKIYKNTEKQVTPNDFLIK